MDDVMCTSIPKVVVHDGRILEKPTSADEARRFIAGYRTSPAQTVGGITVSQPSTGRSATGVDTATIHFGAIPDDIIDALIEEGEVFYCAGGLMVEHPKVQPYVLSIEGTMDGVMGLPKGLILELMAQFFGEEG